MGSVIKSLSKERYKTAKSLCRNGFGVSKTHSHSTVAGGLEVTDLRSVGVMGDERTYDYTLALRAVQSQDFMTATWSRLPYELLDKVSGRIVGEVKHINRICYDITSKPPATVEWE